MPSYTVKWLNSNCQPCVCDVVAVSEHDARTKVEMRGVVEKFISVQESK